MRPSNKLMAALIINYCRTVINSITKSVCILAAIFTFLASMPVIADDKRENVPCFAIL